MLDLSDPPTTLLDMESLTLEDTQFMELPTDLVIVIAEMLAGAYAFGSLANLNLASREIRTETLPILFETVTLDNGYDLCAMIKEGRQDMAAAFRYTKFLIFRKSQNQQSPLHELSTLFPKLLMSVMLSAVTSDPNELHVSVYKPVSFSTAFGVILRTPLHHQSFNHMLCDKKAIFEVFRLNTNGGSTFCPDVTACQEDESRPLVRAPGKVAFITLFGEAYLFGDWSILGIAWKTTIRLHGTVLKEIDVFNSGGIAKHPETLIGLLLLPMMDVHRQEYMKLDRTFSLPKFMRQEGGVLCWNAFPYVQWHLELKMSYSAALNFLTEFTATMRRSSLSPRLRLKILISETLSATRLQTLVTRFAELLGYGLRRECVLLGVGPPWTILALASSYGVSTASGRPMLSRLVCNLQYTFQGGKMLVTSAVRGDEHPLGTLLDDDDFGLFSTDY